MIVKPLDDRIVVRPSAQETKTKSGIYLPESAKEKPQEAEVVAVGDGKLLDNGERAPFQVKAGDRILLSKWGGTELKVDDVEYLVLTEDDVLGVIE